MSGKVGSLEVKVILHLNWEIRRIGDFAMWRSRDLPVGQVEIGWSGV
jgi:hypothetical protein